MKVRDLLEAIRNVDPDTRVVIHCHDSIAGGHTYADLENVVDARLVGSGWKAQFRLRPEHDLIERRVALFEEDDEVDKIGGIK